MASTVLQLIILRPKIKKIISFSHFLKYLYALLVCIYRKRKGKVGADLRKYFFSNSPVRWRFTKVVLPEDLGQGCA